MKIKTRTKAGSSYAIGRIVSSALVLTTATR